MLKIDEWDAMDSRPLYEAAKAAMVEFEHHSVTWFPDTYCSGSAIADCLEALIRDGWIPEVWNYEFGTNTNLRYITVRFIREVPR